MANETSKTKKIWSEREWSFLQGEGIDIGCGPDPLNEKVVTFDVVDGDANNITAHVGRQYDFVFSSHCLEHLKEPISALKEWYSLVRPGGHLFVIVPDEDLYEQGRFPSLFNTDHKWTFTLNNRPSWSPRSLNLRELAQGLIEESGGEILNLELQDHNYDHKLFNHGFGWWGFQMWKWFRKVSHPIRDTKAEMVLSRVYRLFGGAFDQTFMGGDRLAQIQLVMRKPLK